MVATAMMACVSYVLSTFVYFPHMAPFQHMMNVLTACLLGPVSAFAAACITGLMRMILGGRTIQALIGACVGAPIGGILFLIAFKATKNYIKGAAAAVVGESIGTGVLSALLVYPFMVAFYGISPETPFWFYVPYYVPSAVCGALIGFAIITILVKAGTWQRMKAMIDGE